jgi:hypothetical protein
MSHAEILAELPKLGYEERQELLMRLCELQDQDLIHGRGPIESDKKLLDAELEQFERDGDLGEPWEQVERRLWPVDKK